MRRTPAELLPSFLILKVPKVEISCVLATCGPPQSSLLQTVPWGSVIS